MGSEKKAQAIEDCCKAVLKEIKEKGYDLRRSWEKERLIAFKAKEYGVKGKVIEMIILDGKTQRSLF